MKYYISFLVISVIVVSLFSFYDAYAAPPNKLSFDPPSIVMDHSGFVSCVDCTDVGSQIKNVYLGGGTSGPSKNITLKKVVGSSPLTYRSDFIKFTTCTNPCSNPLEYGVAPGNSLTATPPTNGSATWYAADPAPVSATNPSLISVSTMYQKDQKSFRPWNYGLCAANFHGDTDGDYICDDWEDSTNGWPSECTAPAGSTPGKGLCIRSNSTSNSKIYYLSCNDNDPNNKCPAKDKSDIYVEIDWMNGHKPSSDVISAVASSFQGSNQVSKNGVTGINFHYQLDESLPHVDIIPWDGTSNNPGFIQLKYWWFGTASERGYSIPNENLNSNWINNNAAGNQRSQKGQVFHYVIFAHSQTNTGSSGAAESKGNDIMVSLGTFDGKIGSKDQQKGTLLHEFGHNIGLKHGGKDDVGCKPNYLSVMSFTKQFTNYDVNRKLDFSSSQLSTLNENSLNETAGVGIITNPLSYTVYGNVAGVALVNKTGVPIDWNRDGDTSDTGVHQDINFISGISNCPSSDTNDSLVGSYDWDGPNLRLGALATAGEGEGDGVWIDPANITFDPLSFSDEAAEKKSLPEEANINDVTNMRVSRINSLINSIDNIPDSFILGNVVETRNSYKAELNEVISDIMNHNSDVNTLVNATEKLIKFTSRLDGLGSVQIISNTNMDEIISDYQTRDKILNETYEIILSQSADIHVEPPAKVPNYYVNDKTEPSTEGKSVDDIEHLILDLVLGGLVIGIIILILVIGILILLLRKKKSK